MASADSIEEWITSSNDALSINLVAPSTSGLKLCGTFHPKFTYSIFGDEEKIVGYKDPKINIRFRANDMRPHLNVSYGKKLKEIGDSEPTDIKGVLESGGHLPKVAFVKGSDFEDSSQQLADNWTPPGTLHETVEREDGQYEIWRGSLTDPAIKQLNSRIQILVPMFIEGGSYIGQKPGEDATDLDLSDADRWTLFFLYRKQPSTDDPSKSSYVFVGYSTVYRFYYFQPPTPPPSPSNDWELPEGDFDLAELPCRTRLSQFIILPPFQGKGHGALLYNTIFNHYHKHAQTHEFTVEDPNEAFDDLRDVCDLTFLRTLPEFASLHVDASIPIPKAGVVPKLVSGGADLESIRLKAKIAPRQFGRVLEMHLMSQLPDSVRASMALDDEVPTPTKEDKHKEKLWQLIVKQRLYRHNRDVLSQIEPAERIEKLQETLSSVELEYARLLAAYDRTTKHAPSSANGKRKLEDANGETPSKKARVEDA